MMLLLLLAVEVLCLQHLLVLHPSKLVLLLLLMMMLLLLLRSHVRIIAGRRLTKRLGLKLTAKHEYQRAMLQAVCGVR